MDLIHFGSFGCPGTAVEWLERVEARAEKEGARKAIWAFFEREKIKKSRYDTIGLEIHDGEADFEQDDTDLSDVESFTSPKNDEKPNRNGHKRHGRPKRNPKNDACPPRD